MTQDFSNFNNQFTNGQRGPLPEFGTQPLNNFTFSDPTQSAPNFGTQPLDNSAFSGATQSREPLPNFAGQQLNDFAFSNSTQSAPVFNSQPTSNYNYSNANTNKDPLPQSDYYVQSPVFTPTEDPRKKTNPEVQECAESAFGKGIAAIILAWFPVASIFAIFFGISGQKMAKKAIRLAAQYDVSPGGKVKGAKILSLLGLAFGIITTMEWLAGVCVALFWVLVDVGILYMLYQ